MIVQFVMDGLHLEKLRKTVASVRKVWLQFWIMLVGWKGV